MKTSLIILAVLLTIVVTHGLITHNDSWLIWSCTAVGIGVIIYCTKFFKKKK